MAAPKKGTTEKVVVVRIKEEEATELNVHDTPEKFASPPPILLLRYKMFFLIEKS